MPKNLLDDDLGEVDQLKDRYKKQEEEFLKKQRIVTFNDEIARFSAEPKKDVKWAENYLKYFETAKIVNSDILKDVPSEKLFYKMVDDAKMIILKDKEEKEAQQKKLAEIKLAEEKRKKEEEEKRSKEEHEKKVAALEREKELARIQAEKDRIEAEAAAKRAEEKAKRKEQEYLARIVDIEETINVLAKGKRSLFWSKSILDLSTEIQELPTKYRASISNIDKLDNLIKEANKIREEFDVTNEYNRLVDQEKKTKTWLQDVEKARNKLLAIAPKYAISEVEIDDLYKKAIKLTLESEISQLKKYIDANLSKEQVEKYKTIEPLYTENSKYIDFYDNKIGPALSRYWKELDPYRKEIKAEKERERELKKKKAEEKRKKQEQERIKAEKTERNKKIKSKINSFVPVIIFVVTALLIVGGHFLISGLFASSIGPYEQYILGGIALIGSFLSFFLTRYLEHEAIISIIGLVGFGFLAFFPGFTIIGLAGLLGEFIGKLTLFRYKPYNNFSIKFIPDGLNKCALMNGIVAPLVLLVGLIATCIYYVPDPFKYGPIIMLVIGYLTYVARVSRYDGPREYILRWVLGIAYLGLAATSIAMGVIGFNQDPVNSDLVYNSLVLIGASLLSLAYIWIPLVDDGEEVAILYGSVCCQSLAMLVYGFVAMLYIF